MEHLQGLLHASSIVVFGNTVNNGSNICCLTLVEITNEKSCTIFISYGERIMYEYNFMFTKIN